MQSDDVIGKISQMYSKGVHLLRGYDSIVSLKRKKSRNSKSEKILHDLKSKLHLKDENQTQEPKLSNKKEQEAKLSIDTQKKELKLSNNENEMHEVNLRSDKSMQELMISSEKELRESKISIEKEQRESQTVNTGEELPPAGEETEALAEQPVPQIIQEEDDLDQNRAIEHLVLVIHGIGQKMGDTVESPNFIADISLLRKTLKDSSKYLSTTLLPDQAKKIPFKGGIQVLPVQWRKKINFATSRAMLDVTNSDSATLEDIALEGVPGIRALVSDVILDVLLYQTPTYRQEMVLQVAKECNRIAALYKNHNPNFVGKISIYGHSLGSVLAYEILAHDGECQVPEEENTDSEGVDLTELMRHGLNAKALNGIVNDMKNIKFERLQFAVDTFFAVGSPIGLYQLLEGSSIRARTQLDVPETLKCSRPAVTAMYNIFHPFDPVAHRLEPLVARNLKSLKPFPIPYTKGGLTQTIAGAYDMGSNFVKTGFGFFENVRSNIASSAAAKFFTAPAVPEKDVVEGEVKKDESLEMLTLLNPNGRLDYAIQESVLENPYISSLGVHMSYWPDTDCAALIIRALYGIEHKLSQRLEQ